MAPFVLARRTPVLRLSGLIQSLSPKRVGTLHIIATSISEVSRGLHPTTGGHLFRFSFHPCSLHFFRLACSLASRMRSATTLIATVVSAALTIVSVALLPLLTTAAAFTISKDLGMYPNVKNADEKGYHNVPDVTGAVINSTTFTLGTEETWQCKSARISTPPAPREPSFRCMAKRERAGTSGCRRGPLVGVF